MVVSLQIRVCSHLSSENTPQLIRFFTEIEVFITFAVQSLISIFYLFTVCFISASKSAHFNFAIAAMFAFTYSFYISCLL